MRIGTAVWVSLTVAVGGCSLKEGPTGAPGLSYSQSYTGPNCPAGGVGVYTGADANRNAVLDPNEVTQVSYLCAGSPDTPTQVLTKLTQVDGPGSGLDADTLEGWSLQQLIAALQPPGTVLAFAGDTPPTGWLLCDGKEVRRSDYPGLFGAIGTRHGTGDGHSTFNLPDYRGRFLRGVDGNTGRDPDAATRTAPLPGGSTGAVVGSVQGGATALPASAFGTSSAGSHTHSNGAFQNLVAADHLTNATATDNNDSTGTEINLLYSSPMSSAGAHTHALNGGDSETRPKNAAVHFIIRT